MTCMGLEETVMPFVIGTGAGYFLSGAGYDVLTPGAADFSAVRAALHAAGGGILAFLMPQEGCGQRLINSGAFAAGIYAGNVLYHAVPPWKLP